MRPPFALLDLIVAAVELSSSTAGDMDMNEAEQAITPRREFLKTSAAIGGLVAISSRTALSYQANSRLEIGIVGCGGRGTYVGGFFPEFTGASIVALADPFQDKRDALVSKLKISQPRMYGTLDGFRELIHSKLDAVVLTTPPYFRPEHLEEAVRALEKLHWPAAVVPEPPL